MPRAKDLGASHGVATIFRLSRFSEAYRARLLRGLDDLQHYCHAKGKIRLLSVLKSPKQADSLLSAYVLERHEKLGMSGLSMVKHALLCCQHMMPHLKSKLAAAWANVKVWEEKRSTRLRAPVPVPIWLMLVGLARAHACDAEQSVDRLEWMIVALLIELGMLCLLRPGELFRLCPGDFALPGSFSLSQDRAAIRIISPKNRRQFGDSQFVTLLNPSCIAWIRDSLKVAPCDQPLWGKKAARFSRLFKQLTRELGVEDCRFTPASLRPGGATMFFGQGVPINMLRFLGRWTVERSLEHYIQEAMATQILNKLSDKAISRLKKLGPWCLQFVLHSSQSIRLTPARHLFKSDSHAVVRWCLDYAKLEVEVREESGSRGQSSRADLRSSH